MEQTSGNDTIEVLEKNGETVIASAMSSVPVNQEDVRPLNWQMALKRMPEADQQEIRALADAIDVTKIENVMNYGSVPLKATFEQCGEFLKDERGSKADQAVITQVKELSKRASQSYEDFNLTLKEPGFLQKLLLKVSASRRKSQTDRIQSSAVTNYKLLIELSKSMDAWRDMLKEAMGEISYSLESDQENVTLLEKYLIAGYLAKDRIQSEVNAAQKTFEETGLAEYESTYKELQEGANIFDITMANLEAARSMYYLSGGQLELIKRSNRNVQISILTQKNEQMALLGQQLRNAVLNAKNREVLEGKTSLIGLSNEIIKEISTTVGTTAVETEKLIYTGYVSPEAAKEAVTTVINSCEAIQKVASDMLPKMRADAAEINKLADQLESSVASLSQTHIQGDSENGSTTSTSKPVTTGSSGLAF